MSIRVESVSYTYMEDTPLSHTALHELSLTIPDGSFTAIAGETGAGKSTLMQIMGGLVTPTKGNVFVDDTALFGASGKERKPALAARLRVGMVFQYPEHQLFEETVYEDIRFGSKNQGLAEEEIDARVKDAMRLVG
ncbi:ATP-binding cassette domain-containing protein, partial [uncultured Selenomonas sp.]